MRTSKLLSSLWLLLAALALFPAHVLAQPASVDEAEQHYTRGLEAAQANDYQRALDEFQASYQLRQVPRLLINIGTAHFRLGNARKALSVVEAYLQVEPNAPPEIRKKVQDLMGQCKAAIAAQELLSGQQVNASAQPAGVVEVPEERSRHLDAFSRRTRGAILGLSWSMFSATTATTIILLALNRTSLGIVEDPMGPAAVLNIFTPAAEATGVLSAVSLAVAIPITVLVTRAASTHKQRR